MIIKLLGARSAATSLLWIAFYLSLTLPAWSRDPGYTTPQQWPIEHPVPGGTVQIELGPEARPQKVTYQGTEVLVRETPSGWQAVVGIDLNTETGEHEIKVDGRDVTFRVAEHDYEAQYITITEKDMVTPPEPKLKRIFAEQKEIRAAFRSHTTDRQPRLKLHPPVADARVSAEFGLRRYINEQPRNPHSGLDLAAPRGTPIEAAEAGKVVEIGDYYFNGKSILIDHGSGLVTMYCHMDEFGIEKGDWVQRGEQIGTIGETGRVTGAHLHFSVILNANPVNPMLFMQTY